MKGTGSFGQVFRCADAPYPANYQLLDFWRGWAALWVVIFHGYAMFAEQKNFISENLQLLEPIAASGWFGVHLFFVISGYCIAACLATARRKNRGPGQFLRDRLLRIFPVYWCALLAQILLQVFSAPFNKTPWRQAFPESPLEALANLFLLEPYLGFPSRMLVSWSLVYEWGFYVLMAAGLLALQKQARTSLVLLGGMALALAGMFGLTSGFLLPLKFWPEFMIGVGVFVFLQGQGRLVKGCAFSLFFVFPMGLWFLEGGTGRTWMMAGAAGFGLLLCLLRRWDEVLIRWQPVHGLRQVGLFSYSLYLVHVPFGGAFRNLAMRFVSETSMEFLLVQVGYVAVCVATALIFYRLIEAPWERFRKSTFC